MKNHIVSFLNTQNRARAFIPASIRSAVRTVAAVPLLLASLFAEPLVRNKRLPLRKPTSSRGEE